MRKMGVTYRTGNMLRMSVTALRLPFAFEPPEQLDLQLQTEPVYAELLARSSNEYPTKRNIRRREIQNYTL
jgi:hypothetical protein